MQYWPGILTSPCMAFCGAKVTTKFTRLGFLFTTGRKVFADHWTNLFNEQASSKASGCSYGFNQWVGKRRLGWVQPHVWVGGVKSVWEYCFRSQVLWDRRCPQAPTAWWRNLALNQTVTGMHIGTDHKNQKTIQNQSIPGQWNHGSCGTFLNIAQERAKPPIWPLCPVEVQHDLGWWPKTYREQILAAWHVMTMWQHLLGKSPQQRQCCM